MPSLKVLNILALDCPAGVESSFTALVEAARDSGLDNHVLVTRGRVHPWLREALSRHTASLSYLKYLGPFKLPRWPRTLRRWRLRSAVRRVQPDVLLAFNSLGNLALLNAASDECPSAVQVHYERGSAWSEHGQAAVTEYLDRTDGVLCNSHAGRRMLELAWGYPEGRARLCRNGVRLPPPAPEMIPAELPPDGPIRIGFAARLKPYKAPLLVVHALAELRKSSDLFELLVAGSGDEEERMRATAAALGISEAVRFCGPVEDMAAFYSGLHVFVCPSVREPLGNVVIEASLYGCPVVAAAVDGTAEVVVDGETGRLVRPDLPAQYYPQMGGGTGGMPRVVYDPAADALAPPRLCDPEGLADAIRQVCRDADGYRRMSAAANRRIVEEFRVADYVDKLDTELRRVKQEA